MPRRYIPRALQAVLEKAARQFPAVILTGPRQSGKTTLLKHVFGSGAGYVSLELPDVRASVAADPRGFLEMNPPPVIFDEVQYAPDLMPYIKERIDARRSVHGQYFLTGSQNLLLTEGITESLAGRAAMLRLPPLSERGGAWGSQPAAALGIAGSSRPGRVCRISGKVSCGVTIPNWSRIRIWSVMSGPSGKSVT